MLVNEFLKEHRKVEEQGALMARTNERTLERKLRSSRNQILCIVTTDQTLVPIAHRRGTEL